MVKKTKPVNYLESFLRGMAQAFQIAPHREYIVPKRGEGFARDARALRGDFAKVSEDLNYTVQKYGKG